jgi:hypothetical protein
MEKYIVSISSVDPKNFKTIDEFEKEQIGWIKVAAMRVKQKRIKKIKFEYKEKHEPIAICFLEEDFNYQKVNEHTWELIND